MAEGWDGRVRGRLKREGNECILTADSCCCRAEINTTLYIDYISLKKFFFKKKQSTGVVNPVSASRSMETESRVIQSIVMKSPCLHLLHSFPVPRHPCHS